MLKKVLIHFFGLIIAFQLIEHSVFAGEYKTLKPVELKSMLNKKDFSEMRKEFNSYDDNREMVIKKSRDVLKLSKQVIYSVHRDDMKEAAKLVKKIEVEK